MSQLTSFKKVSIGALLLLASSTMSASALAAQIPGQFVSYLSSSQEVVPVDKSTPAATGVGSFLYDKATRTLRFNIHYAGLSGAPIMAHFHLGPRGQGGAVIQDICGMSASACPSGSTGNLQGVWQVPAEDVKFLTSEGIFVNIHTQLNPKGEIRGQIQ